MACRIGNSLIRAELDCTEPGRVRGKLRLLALAGEVSLDLTGRVEPDLEGARVVIENPSPDVGEGAPLTTEQTGEVVFFTLSHRLRLARGERARTAPLRNVVHLEWTSATNGRVVLSGGGWSVSVERLAPPAPGPRGARRPLATRPTADPVDGSMDEFDWERSMRDADEMVETYSQLEREYQDRPDKEQLLARDMGWTWLEDPEVQHALAEMDHNPPPAGPQEDDYPELVPNPATEGVDWIKTADGDIRHPLSNQALEFAVRLWKDLHPLREGLDRDSVALDPDLEAFQFNVRSLSAKLAGALNDVMYDHEPMGGFVTAYLKRALGYFNQAANTLELLSKRALLSADKVQEYKSILHGIRQEILRLMDKYRRLA